MMSLIMEEFPGFQQAGCTQLRRCHLCLSLSSPHDQCEPLSRCNKIPQITSIPVIHSPAHFPTSDIFSDSLSAEARLSRIIVNVHV